MGWDHALVKAEADDEAEPLGGDEGPPLSSCSRRGSPSRSQSANGSVRATPPPTAEPSAWLAAEAARIDELEQRLGLRAG